MKSPNNAAPAAAEATDLGILMGHLIGAGTPKEAAARGRAFLLAHGDHTLAIVLSALDVAGLGILVSPSPPSQHDHNGHIVNGLLCSTNSHVPAARSSARCSARSVSKRQR